MDSLRPVAAGAAHAGGYALGHIGRALDCFHLRLTLMARIDAHGHALEPPLGRLLGSGRHFQISVQAVVLIEHAALIGRADAQEKIGVVIGAVHGHRALKMPVLAGIDGHLVLFLAAAAAQPQLGMAGRVKAVMHALAVIGQR